MKKGSVLFKAIRYLLSERNSYYFWYPSFLYNAIRSHDKGGGGGWYLKIFVKLEKKNVLFCIDSFYDISYVIQ